MKKLCRASLLAAVLVAGVFGSAAKASAEISVGINVGEPPPRRHIEEHRWAPPSRDAVWIRPHYEWDHRQWVWVDGYYTYPPRRGAVYIPGHTEHWSGGDRWRGGLLAVRTTSFHRIF